MTSKSGSEINELRELLKPGDTVFTTLKHVSRSGMSRVVDVYIICNNEPRRLSWNVAKAIGFSYDRRYEGVKVGGCGMDVGFEIVYNLGRVLFPEGFHTKADVAKYPETVEENPKIPGHRCAICKRPLNHCEGVDFHRNGDYSGWDKDGGYALNQRWLG